MRKREGGRGGRGREKKDGEKGKKGEKVESRRTQAVALGDGGGHEGHVLAVTDGRVVDTNRLGVLSNGLGLAGEHGLDDSEVRDGDEAKIGGD